MTNDRNYYRMLSDSELIRVAFDSQFELDVVLAERLSELLNVETELVDAKKLIDELSHRCDTWMEDAASLQAQLNAK